MKSVSEEKEVWTVAEYSNTSGERIGYIRNFNQGDFSYELSAIDTSADVFSHDYALWTAAALRSHYDDLSESRTFVAGTPEMLNNYVIGHKEDAAV